jgi:excisionase family DNA binding protein
MSNSKAVAAEARQERKRRRDGAGLSVPAAAEALNVSYKTLRGAIEQKHVCTIKFGNVERVPESEVARLKEVFAA